MHTLNADANAYAYCTCTEVVTRYATDDQWIMRLPHLPMLLSSGFTNVNSGSRSYIQRLPPAPRLHSPMLLLHLYPQIF
jgi:hypothetical protein